ncbi:Alkaline phosphatase synthesis transcriptional regulatory protein SphR [Acaryochloris thomasi RCC1774]|uniref:Alkaline phosphatase synthesis transcriptional regulatory protein SphR n=1 Tax=Acaryochloris thomasi RCC1774 TaxID=1764569 RepID=A0A2W1JG48_9CYAN|nr:response regulator transcription factor [Acaryochloris thomasi]PZD72590.1 Alkaline phosphatase synthesis transcriptional regulatory protein SphR [Acaryochloris thomasi RCC1774]
MSALHILITEANPHLRSLLGWHLQQAKYVISLASSLQQAQDIFSQQQPEAVIIDSDLPDGHGLEFCQWLQRQPSTLVLMLSAQDSEADIVAGLKAGADDYMTKPFGMQEFMARVEALTRRNQASLPSQLRFGDLKIDLVQRQVHYTQDLIDLTPQEFSLLYVLVQAGGAALSRVELLQRAWPENIDNPRTVDTHILSLRKKIENTPQRPQLIQTVRNVGYRMNMEDLVSQGNRPTISPPEIQEPSSQTIQSSEAHSSVYRGRAGSHSVSIGQPAKVSNG